MIFPLCTTATLIDKVLYVSSVNEVFIVNDYSTVEFCPEVTTKVAWSRMKIMEVPIRYTPQNLLEGKKISFSDDLEAIFTLVKH